MSESRGAYSFAPIAHVSSCYRGRFGIPRQPGLVPAARQEIRIPRTSEMLTAVRGLEKVSHLWVVFVFHERRSAHWCPTVRPPRLGGKKRVGVLATRSPDRPNPIGLSVVKNEGIQITRKEIVLLVSGGDLLEGTPVLDLKPYLPYCDTVAGAKVEVLKEEFATLEVGFRAQAEKDCARWEGNYPGLKDLIEQTLRLDPRPAPLARKPKPTSFAALLWDFDVKFEYDQKKLWVTSLEKVR